MVRKKAGLTESPAALHWSGPVVGLPSMAKRRLRVSRVRGRSLAEAAPTTP